MGADSSSNYNQKPNRRPSLLHRSALLALWLLLPAACNRAEVSPFSFVAIGDMGCACKTQQEVADRMLHWHKAHRYDTVIVAGDAIYPESNEVRGGNRKLFWSHFDRYYQPLMERGVRFYVALGNHDVETEMGAHEIVDRHRFNILRPEGYYSFSSSQRENGVPLITLYALNSNTLLTHDGDAGQLEWLSNALATDQSIWKIAYFHHPIYTADGPHVGEPVLKDRLEPILKSGNVRVVVNGHNHFYSRMKPQNDIYHFTSGGGGRSLYTPRVNDVTDFAVMTHHFMYFQIFAHEIRFYAISASGAKIDEGRIVRAKP